MSISLLVKRLCRCQFHQHFTRGFFVWKFCAKLFCAYILGLSCFLRKNIGANALIKRWWNWQQKMMMLILKHRNNPLTTSIVVVVAVVVVVVVNNILRLLKLLKFQTGLSSMKSCECFALVWLLFDSSNAVLGMAFTPNPPRAVEW